MNRAGTAPAIGGPDSAFFGRAAISAAGIAATVWLVLAPGAGFTILLGAALFAGGYEYRAMTARDGGRFGRVASGLATLAAATGILAAIRVRAPQSVLALVTVVVAALGAWSFLARPRPTRAADPGWGDAIAGPLYFGALPAFLLVLGDAADARRAYWVGLALALSWGGGIGGYVAGRLWGRRRLAPSLSPRKTVEGAIGSLVLGVALGAAVWSTDRGALPPATAAWLLPSAQLLTQAGDLLESGLKRRSGVKDSGRLLLAQGGILDSIDGFCLAAPWLYFASGTPWR